MYDNNLVLRKKYIKKISKKIKKLIYQIKLLNDIEKNISNTQIGGIPIKQIPEIISTFNTLSEKYNTIIDRLTKTQNLLISVYDYITQKMIPNLDTIISEHHIMDNLPVITITR